MPLPPFLSDFTKKLVEFETSPGQQVRSVSNRTGISLTITVFGFLRTVHRDV